MFTDYTAITWVVVAPLPSRGWFWTGLLRTTYPSILDHTTIKCHHMGFPNEQIHYCTTTGFLTTYFILWEGINLRFSSCDDSKGLDHFNIFEYWCSLHPLCTSRYLWSLPYESTRVQHPWLHARYLYDLFDHDATRLSKAGIPGIPG